MSNVDTDPGSPRSRRSLGRVLDQATEEAQRMIHMMVSEAATLMNADLIGDDVEFLGCGTDSRSLEQGALFFALSGEHYDGHAFIDEAHRKGAAGAVVTRVGEHGLPVLVVSDTTHALGQLASAWRERFSLPIIAITGSNGKTTVKELISSIFRTIGTVLSTRGNLNNEYGVPLTLFGLGNEHRFAVVELGANHPGEIASLTSMVRPSLGLITQCGPAHLEGFGSVDGVARAKGELFENLADEGIVVINADDRYADMWRGLAGARKVLTFGIEQEADVSARWESSVSGVRMELDTAAGRIVCKLRLLGRHNVMNALAAATSAVALGISLDVIKAGLEAVPPVKGRLQTKMGIRGVQIIDDSYNANPLSLAVGLSVLSDCEGRRWLVLGDMAELGEQSAEYHREAGELARRSGVERLYCFGLMSRLVAESFGRGAKYYEDQGALIAELRDEITADVTVLVKGSRSMQMEHVVTALTGEP